MKNTKRQLKKFLQWRDRCIIGFVEWSKPYYAGWFKRQQKAWGLSVGQLLAYPAGSLGRELGKFLQKEGFDVIPKLEDHDVMHVLLGYQSTMLDEARMQFFLLGNGKRSAYGMLTVWVALLLVPEGWKAYLQDFRDGRRCLPVWNWNFRHLLREPLWQLRDQLYQTNKGEEPFLLI